MEQLVFVDGENDDVFAQQLIAFAERHRKRHRVLVDQRQRLDASLENSRQLIETLNPMLVRFGHHPIDLSEEPEPAPFALATPGNRSPSTPPRREQYADISLSAAILDVLSRFDDNVHADELTNEIYHISNREQFDKAKRTLVSTLLHGVKRGQWNKTGPNLFRLVKQQGAHQVVEEQPMTKQ